MHCEILELVIDMFIMSALVAVYFDHNVFWCFAVFFS